MTRHGFAGRLALLFFLGALLFSASRGFERSRSEPSVPGKPACTCELERARNGWCAACGLGYVAGCEIRSRVLFDALDAHGHQLDPAMMACETCKALMRTGGFCEACRFGWVGGLAYMSRLTYHLAKGTTRSLASHSCATCRSRASSTGWCEACGAGWIANHYFEDRGDYEDAAHEYERLRAAIEISSRCETCALVLLVDGECPYCHIAYRDGKALAATERN